MRPFERAIIVSLVILSLPVAGMAQGIADLKKLVGEKDQKTLEKALVSLDEAAKLTVEANAHYNDALALQSNYEFDEITLQKKLASAEKRAVSTQIKADKAYSSAYSSVYELCTRMLKGNTVSYGENDALQLSAGTLMDQAREKRKDAANSKNPYEQAGLLNGAAELEGAAIEMLVSALQIQTGNAPADTFGETQITMAEPNPTPVTDTLKEGPATYVDLPEPSVMAEELTEVSENVPVAIVVGDIESENTPAVSEESGTMPIPYADTETVYPKQVDQKSENLAVNQHVLDKYSAYVNDPLVAEPVTFTRAGISGVDVASVDVAREMLQGGIGEVAANATSSTAPLPAQEAEMPLPEAGTSAEPLVSLAEAGESPGEFGVAAQVDANEPNVQMTESSNLVVEVRQAPEAKEEELTPKNAGLGPETKVREAVDLSASPQLRGINFSVQLAASKIPLTRLQLKAIYSGTKTVTVQHDNGWYIYSITGFCLFSEANRVALESGVKQAWVTAEHEGKYIPLTEARDRTRVLEADAVRYGRKVIEDRFGFYVQVAASRVRLNTPGSLPSCCSTMSCREVIEDDWIKYQIFAGNNLAAAQQLKQSLSVESFIVVYDRGEKQKLAQVIP